MSWVDIWYHFARVVPLSIYRSPHWVCYSHINRSNLARVSEGHTHSDAMKTSHEDVGTSFLRTWIFIRFNLAQILAILAARNLSQRVNAPPDAQSSRLEPQSTMGDSTQDLPRTLPTFSG